MTQFGTGGLPATTRRGGSLDVPRTGITVTPNAPGVTPSAPLPNQQLLDLPNQIAQLTTGLVQAAVKIQKVNRAEQQRIDTLEHGMGSRDGRIELARFNDLIRTGQIDFDPNDTNEDIARRHFEEFSQGFSQSYREGAESAFVANAINATSIESKRLRKVQLEQGIEAVGSSIAGIGDTQQIRDQVEAARPFKGELSEAEFQFNLFSEALGAARESGDTLRLNQLLELADQIPEDTRLRLINQTDTQRLKLGGLRQNSLIDQLRRANAQGSPFVMDDLQSAVDDGTLDPNTGARLREELTGVTQAQLLRIENRNIRRAVFEQAAQASDHGGLSDARDLTYQDSSGVERTITADQIKKAVTTQKIDGILADESLDDGQKITQSVGFMSRNRVTYEPFRNQILAASSVTFSDLTSDEIPDTVSRGFELFKNIRAIDGQVLALHLKGEPEARKFLERALLLESVKLPGETQASLLEAKRSLRPDAQQFPVSIDQAALDDAANRVANRFFSQDADNLSTIRGMIGRLARIEVQATGVSFGAAADHAADLLDANFSVINGHLINTRANPLPQDTDVLVSEALKQYFEDHGSDEGLDSAKDLSLVPDDNGLTWQIVRMDMGSDTPRPVENVPDSLITTEQLKEFRRVIRDRVVQQAVLDSKDRGITQTLKRDTGKLTAGVVETGAAFGDLGLDALSAVLAGATGTPQENKAARARVKARLKQVELGPLLTKTRKGMGELVGLSGKLGLVALEASAFKLDDFLRDVFNEPRRDRSINNGRTR